MPVWVGPGAVTELSVDTEVVEEGVIVEGEAVVDTPVTASTHTWT